MMTLLCSEVQIDNKIYIFTTLFTVGKNVQTVSCNVILLIATNSLF